MFYGSEAGSQLELPSRGDLIRALQLRDEYFARYRDLWYEEYLTSPRETAFDLYQDSWENRIKIGDLVIISSPIKPRSHWSMGRVTKLHPDDEGVVRSAALMRSDRTEGTYAIKHLYPLELSVQMKTERPEVPSPEEEKPRRTKRAAAQRCLERLSQPN